MDKFYLVTFDDNCACEGGYKEFPITVEGDIQMRAFLDRAITVFKNIEVRKVSVVQKYNLSASLTVK